MIYELDARDDARHRRSANRNKLGALLFDAFCYRNGGYKYLPSHLRGLSIGKISLQSQLISQLPKEVHQTFSIIYPDLPTSLTEAWAGNEYKELIKDQEWAGVIAIKEDGQFGHVFTNPENPDMEQTIVASSECKLADDITVEFRAQHYMAVHGYSNQELAYNGIVGSREVTRFLEKRRVEV